MMDPAQAGSSVLSAAGLWGDTQFSDATIVFGDRTWKVHRWVICRQSDYFMRALEGEFKEAQNKTIVLMESKVFNAEDVDAMLKFLYTGRLQANQERDSLNTFAVGDYFRIMSLRSAGLSVFKRNLEAHIERDFCRTLQKIYLNCLSKWPDTDIEKVLAQVAAAHARIVIHAPGMMWDEIINAHPGFANKVLKEAFPKLESQKLEPQTSVSRGSAFDDTRRPNTQSTQTTQRGAARFTPY